MSSQAKRMVLYAAIFLSGMLSLHVMHTYEMNQIASKLPSSFSSTSTSTSCDLDYCAEMVLHELKQHNPRIIMIDLEQVNRKYNGDVKKKEYYSQ